MKYTLEICIPAYKRPKELRRCIESLVVQREFRTGLVTIRIFDDAPDDPSKSTIQNFLEKYPKQIVYRKNLKNLGFEENIAQLLEAGTSKYCLFITDDDFFFPGSLQRLSVLFEKYPDLTLVRTAFSMKKDGKHIRTHRLFQRDKHIFSNDILSIARIFRDSDALSGTCFLRSALDIQGYRRHIGTMYPHMYLVGKFAFSGASYYLSSPIIHHAVGNQVFWEYADDYMISGIIAMIRDLDKQKRGFFTTTSRFVFSSVPYIVYINLFHLKRLYRFLAAMVEKKYIFLSVFWYGCALGIYQLLKEKLSH